jgi:hypothetical protein
MSKDTHLARKKQCKDVNIQEQKGINSTFLANILLFTKSLG